MLRHFNVVTVVALTLATSNLNAQHSCLDMRRGMSAPAFKAAANASRSDSIDILHQRIELDLTQAGSNNIIGHCMIRFTPKVGGIDQLPLDLLDLTIDSVSHSSGPLAFSHIGELVNVQLDQPYSPSDTVELTVSYHGDPAKDASGFGGFYLTNTYLYNLGVAFNDQPHSYGRAWFPCFDNFVERNTYEFIVTTNGGKNAWCNGSLVSEVQIGSDTLIRHWSQQQTIPSYLAALAASDYTVVRDTFPSIQGSGVPVTLIARPSDTTDMKSSFLHLQDSFDKFEQGFGPYRWDRVGYALTPNGAMEHPTLISYPNFIADGSLQFETTMAHELGHMWWGDLVTCDRAEEMWINEGFAEYLSYLMLEAVYGHEEYISTVQDNHYNMVRRAHLVDGDQFLALSEVPQDYTYGEHSYNKGADVIHTMRSYMGDAAFYSGLTSFLNANEFESVNSVMLRDHLTTVTGIDMTAFFDNWILNPGWASFEVDSFAATPNGNDFDVTVHLEQKLRGAPALFSNVPVTLTMIDATGGSFNEVVTLDGQFPVAQFTSPIEPVRVWMNADDRISLAVTGVTDTITSTGLKLYSNANFRLDVQSISGMAVIRAEQYWTAADDSALDQWGYVVSPDRWWRLSGEVPSGTVFNTQLWVDARPTAAGNLDPGLIQIAGGVTFHEDSLAVLYRADPSQPWEPLPDITIHSLGNLSDGYARIVLEDIQLGDYCFGWRKSAVGVDETAVIDNEWSIHPNPSSGVVQVTNGSGKTDRGTLLLLDAAGREVRTLPWIGPSMKINVDELPRQAFSILLHGNDGSVQQVGRLVLE